MKRAISLLTLSLCMIGSTAWSQQAGVYAGKTSQGRPIEIYIDPDGQGGLVFSLFGVSFKTDCEAGNATSEYWYAFADTPISTAPVSFELRADFLYEIIELKFTPSGDQLVGSFLGKVPAFENKHFATRPPATLCSSGELQFRASLQPAISTARGSRPASLPACSVLRGPAPPQNQR